LSADEPVRHFELDARLARAELAMEKRLGAVEADVEVIKTRMIVRNGPIVDELRKFEQNQNTLDSHLGDIQRRLDNVVTKDEAIEIARKAIGEGTAGTRSFADFGMRVVMFLVSIGTLIFVVQGPK
jgi:hypothetical protein